MLKVGYRSNKVLESIKEIDVPEGLSVTFEQNDPSLEEMSAAFKAAAERGDIPKGIGGMPPEGWIDAGRFIVSVITSENFIQTAAGSAVGKVIGNAIWPYVKRIYFKVFPKPRENKIIRDAFVIVTDQHESSPHQVSISFILNSDLTEEELDSALQSLPIARESLLRAYLDPLLNLDLENSGVIEARYVLGRWLVERKDVIEYREIPKRPNFIKRFFTKGL